MYWWQNKPVLASLLAQRRQVGNSSPSERTRWSKLFKKTIRKYRHAEQSSSTSNTLQRFSALSQILVIQTCGERKLSQKVEDSSGQRHQDHPSIADVLAFFYEGLYDPQSDGQTYVFGECESILAFTRQALTSAMGALKTGRCADTNIIHALTLKIGRATLFGILLNLFNLIMSGNLEPARAWAKFCIIVPH